MIDTVGLVILLTFLAHTIADFHLQGILATMKQRQWWVNQIDDATVKEIAEYFTPGTIEEQDLDIFKKQLLGRYSADYMVALIIHGLEWSICVSLPALLLLDTHIDGVFAILFTVAMGMLHSIIDDMKANSHSINLVQDQLLHICQIAFMLWIYIDGGI